MNIFVGNLSYQAMDSDLKKLFSEFGEVRSAKVVIDNFSRRSRGFAFIDMEDSSAGNKAIEKLNNSLFMQKSITVKVASDKPDKKWN
jgi:RNA recognition motif-containing protein